MLVYFFYANASYQYLLGMGARDSPEPVRNVNRHRLERQWTIYLPRDFGGLDKNDFERSESEL